MDQKQEITVHAWSDPTIEFAVTESRCDGTHWLLRDATVAYQQAEISKIFPPGTDS